jgi:hypothetical protein
MAATIAPSVGLAHRPAKEDLWLRASQSLSNKYLKEFDFEHKDCRAVIADALAATRHQQEQFSEGGLGYTRKDGKRVSFRSIFDKIVKWIEKFQDTMDFFVSLDVSGHATLPWAGVKMCLKVEDEMKF